MRSFMLTAAFVLATSSPVLADDKAPAKVESPVYTGEVCTPNGDFTVGRHALTVCVDTVSMTKSCAAALHMRTGAILNEDSVRFEEDDAHIIYAVGKTDVSPSQHITCQFIGGAHELPVAEVDG